MAERRRPERALKRVRVHLDGRLVADSRAALLVWEVPYYPAYYIPVGDVRAELTPNGGTKHSESRGDAVVCDVSTGGATAEGAALRYDDSAVDEVRGHVRFPWDDRWQWFEEDEPVSVHARDPYKRVDILGSSQHVRIEVDGVTVAESSQPRILFETSLVPRYYLPMTDVRLDLLRPSGTQTRCPYKGTASYYSVEIDGKLTEDVVWFYTAPLPESQKVQGLACFYDEQVDVYLDGVLQARPETPFR